MWKFYNMKKIFIFAAVALTLSMFSCVSPKKLAEAEAKYNQLNAAYNDLLKKLNSLDSLSKLKDLKITDLENQLKLAKQENDQIRSQIEFLNKNNNLAVEQLKNLQVISVDQAASIKKSLDNLGAKDLIIDNLQQAVAHRDSLNLALVLNLKSAIGDLNDKDIEIKIEKDVVFIQISDALLFKEGSYDLTPSSSKVLDKVAKVMIAQPDLEFMVEGHTDSLFQQKTAVLYDNWDLSVKRATAVVRALQSKYNIDPVRMTAAGRSQYQPSASNDTEEGRAKNRNIRIIILPQLDQFFKLLEIKK